MHVTPNGKEVVVVNKPGTGHYKVQFTSGGELPAELSGFFTKEHMANMAIFRYLENKKTK